MGNPIQTGMLAFLYDLSYNMDVQKEFRGDSTSVMKAYELSSEEIAAVMKAGVQPTDENLLAVVSSILPYMKQKHDDVW